MLNELLNALEETLFMVFASGLFTLLLGLPLGILLAITQPKQFLENTLLHKTLSSIITTTRSIPYLVLMIALIPLTRFLIHREEGCLTAIIPLTLAATPFFAKSCEQAIQSIPKGVIEAVRAMGASPYQIIRWVLLPEAQSGIIQGLTVTLIHLIGYSTVAGALGSGGLGSLAIHKGYEAFQINYVLATCLSLILLTQVIQLIGNYIGKVYLFK